MKVGRQYLGKVIQLTWRDPGTQRVPLHQALKGRDALAMWDEYGLVDDITDGVVRIIHSSGKDPGARDVDEIAYTVVDESLVEKIVVYEPVPEPRPA